MISGKLYLLGATLCLAACMSGGYPNIRPIHQSESALLSPSERAYQDGKDQLANGYAGLAVVAFERAIRLDPNSIAALNGIGAAYDDLKRYDIAQRYYRRALALAPHSTDTLNNLAVSLQFEGDPSAGEWFARAALSDPANPVVTANIELSRSQSAVPPAGATRTIADAEQETAGTATADSARPSLERVSVSEVRLTLPGTGPPSEPAPMKSNSEAVPVVATIAVPAKTAPAAAPAENPAPVSAPVAAREPPVSDGRGVSPIAVSNCTGRGHMARRFRDFLRRNGAAVGHILNAPQFDCERSIVLKRTGQDRAAAALAQAMPIPVAIEIDNAMADSVRLVLGRDLFPFDRTLGE